MIASIIVNNSSKQTDRLFDYDIPKNMDVKVGHHGSNSSSTKEFIKYISPSEAIISVGKNSYGHPHKETLLTLEEQNVEIKRTDILGSITYSWI